MVDRIKVPAFKKENGFETTEQRSKIMSKIRGRDTKPELIFRKALWAKGVRYRTCTKSLPGKPDVSCKSKKYAVFIDGEFWHGHDWENRKARLKTNREFWIAKIERNMQRAEEVDAQLEAMGIKVFRFWARQVEKDLDGCLSLVLDHIRNKNSASK